jgi:hypothetical protein
MTTPSITRQAVPMAAKALLKLSIAILIAGPATLPRGWPLRLLAGLTIQFLRHLPALLPPAHPWPLSYEWPCRILAAAINFFAN